ncbi:hypothetical protein DM02DRAFT_694603 [Periconia macrospinosa]|uniref:Zn(2)-C6 fungal-type domain-containing protein n=1 Tax=Periconia macrospinosa TaxID=97972 RepID=A0A2V1E192_9PLEO|nr:hypothetical protein DM02DRAFT_694603 [Periconia macrospinosa]
MLTRVGPYDGRRARRKRCTACAKRKIKCQGGLPCDYCTKTKQTCQPNIPKSRPALVFVSQETQMTTINAPQSTLASSNDFEKDLAYFTACFLPMNLFSGQLLLECNDLQAMLRASPASQYAISAISSLHRCLTFMSTEPKNIQHQGMCRAMESYSQSVNRIQSLIYKKTFQSEPYTVWSTFLLGIFELMRDNTGQNWLKHFLSGTCAIIRLQHPSSLVLQDEHSIQRRRFFLSTRIFEISRSLIFTEPTFLADPSWTEALSLLWVGEGLALWHPKEALFDILPKFSHLGICALRFVHTEAAQLSLVDQYARTESLGAEGLSLRRALQEWQELATQWSIAIPHFANRTDGADIDLLIAQAYFHAISIYLSGIFDYHVPWTKEGAPCAPILPRHEVEHHIAEIFGFCKALLNAGVAGIMLFFPLRVTGARSRQVQDQNEVLSFFREISQRGYSTATTLVAELCTLWGSS